MDNPSDPFTDGATARNQQPASSAPTKKTTGQPTIVRPRSRAELTTIAVARWREALVDLAGSSSLTDVRLLGDASLDLAGAHPSGVAQLFSGRPTRLSNLFRDPATLPTARRRARLVTQSTREQAERYGVAPTFLAIGVASWSERQGTEREADDVAALARVLATEPGATGGDSGAKSEGSDATVPGEAAADAADAAATRPPAERRIVRAPVLLRPVSIRSRGDGETDYELTLEPNAEINPVVARALRSRGALLDPAALARATFDGAGFHPGSALDRIDSLGRAVFDDFDLNDRTVVGTFLHPGQLLVDDLDEWAGLEHHEVIAALAGHEPSAASLAINLPEHAAGDIEPNQERGVGDLDPSGRRVLDALATGGHLFIDAPVGSNTAAVLAAVVAEAAAIGRSVLYVPGHRRAASALKEQLSALGLADLTLDVPPDPNWRSAVSRRLLGSMTRDAEPVDINRIGRVRKELGGVRHELAKTIDALHVLRPMWGISAYDALQALVRLTSQEPMPLTRARLSEHAAHAMTGPERQQLGATLKRLAASGGLTPEAAKSPWYGAHLPQRTTAEMALASITRLLDSSLVTLGADIANTTESTGLTAPETVTEWSRQLSMLSELRGTLDTFQPLVFETSVDDLVAATASKAWRAENNIDLPSRTRRQLVKRAKDMLRPGTHVDDLHAELLVVQTQRAAWIETFPGAGWPRLPQGLSRIEDNLAGVLADLNRLEPVVSTTTGGGGLSDTPFAELVDRLAMLRAHSDNLDGLQERAALNFELESAGLGSLLADLRTRSVPAELVEAELELAWWSAVFDAIVTADPYLSKVDGARIETMAARFRALDAEHLRLLVQPISSAVVGHIQRTLNEHGDQADELFAELIDERLLSVRSTWNQYADVVRKLRPVMIATPTLVPQLTPPHRTMDLVIIDAAQHLPLETVLASIARGRQIVVVGDPRCASGSAISATAEVLTRVVLTGDSATRDPALTKFLVEHGYEGVLRPTPLPKSERLVEFVQVSGSGIPDATSGAVEVTQEEVARVVELAVEHAMIHPDESLAVVASTRLAADRIRDELLAEVRAHPALAEFFDPRSDEPVVIVDLAGVSGLQRDAVLYSVAFGRTVHGRVLHRFGPLGEDGGDALLLNALGVTRGRLTIVSSFTTADLDPERLRTPGSQLLVDVLAFAQGYDQPNAHLDEAPEHRQPNRLFIDLAERLWRTGLIVETSYGFPGGDRIPLVVGHPNYPGEMFVAVLTDDEDYIAEPSIRVRDRQHAARLENLGWQVLQVWSVSLFLDPERQADRIRRAVFDIVNERELGGTAPSPAIRASELVDRALNNPLDVVSSPDDVTTGTDVPEHMRVTVTTGALPVLRLENQQALFDVDGFVVEERVAAAENVPQVRGERPPVTMGLPISAYSDDQLDDLVAWVAADDAPRTDEQLAIALHDALGLTRRNNRVEVALNGTVSRFRSRG